MRSGAERAAELSHGCVGNTGRGARSGCASGGSSREACLPETLLGHGLLRQQSLPCCVLSDVNSLFPALTIEMPVCSLPGTSPPRGPAVIARIWGLLCAVHTFSSKGGSVPCPYCKNTSWFAERWRGGVPAALLPGSLLFHHHRPAPWCSSRAVPRPLWS